MNEEINPLLKKITMPGKRFRLPSRGLFYKNGEISETVKDGEVEIFSMTAVDEITLRSPEFLFNGEAIERVLNRCIPEINKPLKMLSKDIDYLLACLRVVSYGGSYQINTHCPVCEEKQEKKNEILLQDFLNEVKEKAEEQNIPYESALMEEQVKKRIKTIQERQSDEHIYSIDLMGIIQNNTSEINDEDFEKYNIVLSNGQKISITPLKMDTSVAILQFQNEDNTLNLTNIEEFVAFLMASTVLSVDDITDNDLIAEWSKSLPIKLKEEMEKQNEKISSWGTDFTYTVICKDENCNHERNISTLLNPITFFMTPSKLEE